ncbi:MAG: hypothetical protein UW70_C0094G0001, partial [Candidatus Peregrinibacteria bacterium GW2011_GWA2_44_7]
MRVIGTSITNGATGVSYLTKEIGFMVNEPVLFSTVSPANIIMNPVIPGVIVAYNIGAQTFSVNFGNATMTPNTTYTLQLNGADVRDAANNQLDGNSDGIGGDNYSLSFTTGAEDNTVPQMQWADCTALRCLIGFNIAMQNSTVMNSTNWVLKNAQGQLVNLNGANFRYNFEGSGQGFSKNELEISGLNLVSAASYTLVAQGGVKGLNKVSFGNTGNTITLNAHGDYNKFDDAAVMQAGGTGFYLFGGGDVYSANMKAFSPVSIRPFNKKELQSSAYGVNLPLTQSIPSGGKIILTFPGGFNVTNAAMVATNRSSLNSDINGAGTGTLTISSVTTDNINKKVTLVTAGGATASNDYLHLDLDGIVNGTASTVNWNGGTGGYTVSAEARTALGAPLESNIVSERFEITAAGAGQITVNVKDSQNAGIQNAKVHIENFETGEVKQTTDISGQTVFIGLNNGTYRAWVEGPNENYSNILNIRTIELTQGNSSKTENFTLNSLSLTLSGTITHPGISAGGNVEVELFAGSPNGWFSKVVTLENDGSTNFALKAGAGEYNVGIRQSLKNEFSKTAALPTPEFFPPSEKKITLVNQSLTGIDFTLGSANRTINVIVKDQNDNRLNGVGIWAYNPRGGSGGAWGQTGADGTAALKVADGEYTVGASKPGLPNTAEQRVEVNAGNSSPTLTIKFSKATASIAGTITDGSNPMQYVSVTCFSNKGFKESSVTDSTGAYTLFVRGGLSGETYTCEASSPQYGRLSAVTGVTISNFTVSTTEAITGKNFEYNSTTFRTIMGSVGQANVSVWAEEVNASGNFVSWGGGVNSDNSGNYKLYLPPNTVGNSYQIHAWSPSIGGELGVLKNIDVSAGNASNKNFTLPTLRTLTIALTNVPSGISKVLIDVMNPTTNMGNNTVLKVTNGVASGTMSLGDGSYEARASIEGFGQVRPDTPNNGTFTL